MRNRQVIWSGVEWSDVMLYYNILGDVPYDEINYLLSGKQKYMM